MDDKFNVNHSGKNYDIREFLRNHPGGFNYVEPYRNKDVSQAMANAYHSEAAFYLLKEYKVGGRDHQDDEDLEKLVDWEKPMLSQVTSLGARYKDWVNSPVDRKLRLFANPILENLTITPWYVVPIVWLPVSFYFIFSGILKYNEYSRSAFSFIPISLGVVCGIVLWTLVEYTLHRWVFHITPSGKSKLFIYIHFTIHGLHHKVPFDTRRLVFPPVPAALVVYLGYKLYSSILPNTMYEIITGGTILGYILYDMIHFYIHHGNPPEGSYLYSMKRYHSQHHFGHHESGFGISNQYWDIIFGTFIKLRKLTKAIRWRATRNGYVNGVDVNRNKF